MAVQDPGGVSGRLPPPPVPPGMSVRDFGNKVMRWGTGHESARARIATLTREELERAGVTLEIAEAWREFYLNEAARNSANPSAAGRGDLMRRAVELLSRGR